MQCGGGGGGTNGVNLLYSLFLVFVPVVAVLNVVHWCLVLALICTQDINSACLLPSTSWTVALIYGVGRVFLDAFVTCLLLGAVYMRMWILALIPFLVNVIVFVCEVIRYVIYRGNCLHVSDLQIGLVASSLILPVVWMLLALFLLLLVFILDIDAILAQNGSTATIKKNSRTNYDTIQEARRPVSMLKHTAVAINSAPKSRITNKCTVNPAKVDKTTDKVSLMNFDGSPLNLTLDEGIALMPDEMTKIINTKIDSVPPASDNKNGTNKCDVPVAADRGDTKKLSDILVIDTIGCQNENGWMKTNDENIIVQLSASPVALKLKSYDWV